MDRTGADFERCVEMIADRLGALPVPVQLPMGAEDRFEGVIDLIEMKAVTSRVSAAQKSQCGPIPAEFADAAEAAREVMVERVAENDDQLMISFLEGHEIEVVELGEGDSPRHASRTRSRRCLPAPL